MFPLSESELQNKIIELIKSDKFKGSIRDIDTITSVLNVDKDKDFLPGFQIDFQLKTKYARGANEVLDALSLLELINDEGIKNISLQRDNKSIKERLYPDVILINKELDRLILIELKKDKQTEREAITELLAYAIEIKNHLPNIADSDIQLIVISTEYNTLLDHAVSSLILGTKFNVLALKASYIDELNFDIHFPNSWTDIWQNSLPPYAFSSVTVVPYNYDNSKKLPEKIFLFETISDLIMFEGAKHNSHGFFIIWENITAFEGPAEFCISLYQINPFVFLQASLDKKFTLNTEEPLSKHILKEFKDEGPYYHMESLLKVSLSVKNFLDKWYDTSYEDFSSWTDHMQLGSNFRMQAMPRIFNSWGDIGDYIRYFFFHPSLTGGFFSEIQLNSPFHYKDPVYGIEMINRISGLTLFEDGVFRISSLYRFAVQLREYLLISDMFYRSKIEKKKYELLSPRLLYSSIDLLSSLREIQYRVNTSTDKFEKFGGLKIYLYDVSENPVENIFKYHEWFSKSFLGENRFHKLLYNFFFNWCILYMDDFSGGLKANEKSKLENELIDFVKSYLASAIVEEIVEKTSFYGDVLIDKIKYGYFNGKLPKFKNQNAVIKKVESITDTTILNTFEDVFLNILDLTVPEVFHGLTPLPDLSSWIKDWEHYKRHLIKRFHEGHKYGCILIQPNGGIGIGVLPKEFQIMTPIEDPEKEVYILNNESGIGLIEKVSWDEVKSGKPFKKFDEIKKRKMKKRNE